MISKLLTRSLRHGRSVQRARFLSAHAERDVSVEPLIFGDRYEEEMARTIPWIDPLEGVFSEESYRKTKAFAPMDSDIFIATYQKSGTTWTQWIVYNLLMKGDLSRMDNLITAIPFLEAAPFWDRMELQVPDTGLPCRVMKVHTSWELTPTTGNAKYINVARYGPDVAVSWYKHQVGYLPEKTKFKYREQTFDEFIDDFMKGHTPWGDYFAHVADWYKRSLTDDRVLFISYEDLKANFLPTCRTIADFCGTDISDDEIESISPQLDFKFMKETNNIDFNMLGIWPDEFQFFRKGIVGDHKNNLSPEQIAAFDQKLEEAFGGGHPWSDYKQRFGS